jgi:hypothetical protein
MRSILPFLIVVQVLGVAFATLIALGNIRTIQYSGPLLSATGLAIAFVSFRRNRPRGLYFGLAAPTASVFCFSVIAGSGWSPPEAQSPVLYILVDVVLLHFWAGYVAICEITDENHDDPQRVPFQFSIMALLVLMLLVSVSFGLYDMLGKIGAAIAAQFAYIIVVAYCLRLFHTSRARIIKDGGNRDLPHSPP